MEFRPEHPEYTQLRTTETCETHPTKLETKPAASPQSTIDAQLETCSPSAHRVTPQLETDEGTDKKDLGMLPSIDLVLLKSSAIPAEEDPQPQRAVRHTSTAFDLHTKPLPVSTQAIDITRAGHPPVVSSTGGAATDNNASSSANKTMAHAVTRVGIRQPTEKSSTTQRRPVENMDTGVEEYSRAGGSTDKLIKVQIEHTAQTVQNEEEPEQRPAQRETQMRIALEEVSYGGPETFTTNQEEPKSNPEDRRQATEAQPVAQQDSAIGADESATVTEHDQHEEEVDGVSDQSPPTQAEETSTGEQAATRLELLHQGANGDDEALAELLMKHYYKELVRFASARIDRSRAEDIVSDVVTRLLIRPEAIEVREPAPLSAFRNMLYTAIRNRVIDYGRHDTMMRRIGERDYVEALIMTIPEPSLAPDLEAVRQDVWRRVIGILEREMMKSQVNVFYDVYVLGLSIPECAAHRHIPTGTAKRRAMAARRVLRKAVLSGELELW